MVSVNGTVAGGSHGSQLRSERPCSAATGGCRRKKGDIRLSLMPKLKSKIRAGLVRQRTTISGTRGVQKWLIRKEFLKDGHRYAKFSSPTESSSPHLSGVGLESQLTRDYHRVEKGLALPSPKRPFGEGALLQRLNDLIPVAHETAHDAPYVRVSVAARDALLEWNEVGTIADEVSPVAPEWSGLDRSVTESFFKNRRSVRHFTSEPIDLNEVHRAIELAAYSPSVCNRQPWKVRLFAGENIARVIRHQSGSRGFSDGIPLLALISVELGYFVGRRERNQAWIDGGIFASSLVWSLHGLGLHSCMLNLSITNNTASALRKDAGLPDSEVPIMMVAIGNGAEGHRAARSVRRQLGQILVGKDGCAS